MDVLGVICIAFTAVLTSQGRLFFKTLNHYLCSGLHLELWMLHDVSLSSLVPCLYKVPCGSQPTIRSLAYHQAYIDYSHSHPTLLSGTVVTVGSANALTRLLLFEANDVWGPVFGYIFASLFHLSTFCNLVLKSSENIHRYPNHGMNK